MFVDRIGAGRDALDFALACTLPHLSYPCAPRETQAAAVPQPPSAYDDLYAA